jgi:hypothetical protein
VEALEETGKGVGAFGGDEPVNVVIHDAVAVNEHAFFLGNEGEAPKVALLFESCGKQFVSVNPARNDVVGRARDDTAGGASHVNLLEKQCGSKAIFLGFFSIRVCPRGHKGLSPRAWGCVP